MEFLFKPTRSRAIWLICLGVFVLLMGGIYLVAFRWSPAAQIRMHQMRLIDAAEHNSRAKLEELISDSYKDQWGFSKKDLLIALRDMRRAFTTVEATPEVIVVHARKEDGAFSTVIRIDGIGYGAEEVKSEINTITTPFVFHWRKEGPKPWDWGLVRVTNDGLDLGGYTPVEP